MDSKFKCENCGLEATVHFHEVDYKHSQMYCNRCGKLTMHLVSKRIEVSVEMEKELTERGSVIQHYKGGIYIVLDIGTHSETGDIMVSYQSLKDNQVWFRPIYMFYEEVEFKGELVPRFKVFQ